mmetsp:Transcript_16729/g.45054  ORF Transcript_16729/g.45054 Transcript_16729/m.45054 type:complete len:200 (+) Transcript_16729:495-1094(+)
MVSHSFVSRAQPSSSKPSPLPCIMNSSTTPSPSAATAHTNCASARLPKTSPRPWRIRPSCACPWTASAPCFRTMRSRCQQRRWCCRPWSCGWSATSTCLLAAAAAQLQVAWAGRTPTRERRWMSSCTSCAGHGSAPPCCVAYRSATPASPAARASTASCSRPSASTLSRRMSGHSWCSRTCSSSRARAWYSSASSSPRA